LGPGKAAFCATGDEPTEDGGEEYLLSKSLGVAVLGVDVVEEGSEDVDRYEFDELLRLSAGCCDDGCDGGSDSTRVAP